MIAGRELFILRKQRESTAFNHFFLSILVVFSLGPVLLLAVNSFKSNAEMGLNPLGLPQQWRLDNFGRAWEKGEFERTFKNSIIYVIGTVAAELVFGGLAAYSLARKNPPGGNLVMIYLLVASTVPIWLYLVPLFFMWRQLGFLNTYHGLILIYIALNAPFSIFLLRSYLIGLPARTRRRGPRRWRQRTAGAAQGDRALGLARLLDRRLGSRLGRLERVSGGSDFHAQTGDVPGDDELLQIHRPFRPRLGFDQRRRLYDGGAGADTFPGAAAPLRRRLDPRRRQVLAAQIDGELDKRVGIFDDVAEDACRIVKALINAVDEALSFQPVPDASWTGWFRRRDGCSNEDNPAFHASRRSHSARSS